MSENEINTVHVLIRRFLYEIDGILVDKDKCQEWLVSFAKTLQFQDLCKEPNEYAVFLLREARGFCATQKRNSQIKQVRKILKEEGILSPTKEQLETRWKEMYGLEEANETTAGAPNGDAGVDSKSATSCDQLTADGDTREGSLDEKSGTSANNYATRQAKNGDAPHSDAGDESATVSGNNKGRSPDVEGSTRYPGSAGERPKNLGSAVSPHTISTDGPRQARDSRGSGRYQPPSLGPEDGNIHDQETASGNYQVPDKVSTDEKGGCGPLEIPNSQKSPQPSLFPVAKPEKRRYGKYRHVLLTDEEGRKLRESLGEDLEDAVAILDEYIQSLPVKAKGAKKNGAKWWMQEYEAKDHYIVLHHGWARKRLNEMRTDELNAKAAELRYSAAETNAKAAEKRLENANSSGQPRQMYLTSDDISRRNAEEGWRQLQLMHQMEGNG